MRDWNGTRSTRSAEQRDEPTRAEFRRTHNAKTARICSRTRNHCAGSLPIMFRTVSESPRPQREIVGALGRFVAAVVSMRRNEGSPFDWHETAMRFESGMIGRRPGWKGHQRSRQSDKTAWQVECGIGTVQRTHEEIPGRPFGQWRAEGTL